MESIRYLACVLVIGCMLTGTFAGRAFPVPSENFAVGLFQRVNPNLEWDPTNFLVDLSGRLANCKNIGQKGVVPAPGNRLTPEGVSIGGMLDYTTGHESYSDSVQKYIEDALQDWIYTEPYLSQIKNAERFGCSVQPGCSGMVSIACLFSPGEKRQNIEEDKQWAQAFTSQQYEVAEKILGMAWDREHFLENLSGFETTCSLINKENFNFEKAKEKGAERGMRIKGFYGHAENRGKTQPAMEEIMSQWNPPHARKIGCSVIPDCVMPRSGRMMVVVGCLFSDR